MIDMKLVELAELRVAVAGAEDSSRMSISWS